MSVSVDDILCDPFRKLTYNNIFTFFGLLEELNDTCAKSLQKKVNEYIQTTTRTKICFFIYTQYSLSEMYLDVVGSKDLNPALSIEETCLFFETVSNIRKPTAVIDFELEENLKFILKHILEEDFKVKFENCVIFPVLHPKNRNVMFHYALVNTSIDDHIFEKTCGIIGEVFRYTVRLLSNIFELEEERRHHDYIKSGITVIHKILQEIGKLEDLCKTIKEELCYFFGAERCYILILYNDNLVTRIVQNKNVFDLGYEDLKDVIIPLGVGVQGKVAKTKKLIRSNGHLKFTNYLHKKTGLIPKNLLCFPIYFNDDIFGVIELHDKKNGSIFTKCDELYALPFGIVCGSALGKCIPLKSLEYDRYVQFKGDVLLLRSLLLKELHLSRTLQCTDGHLLEYDRIKFVPLEIPEKHTICYCVKMFHRLNLNERYNILELRLIWFFSIVKNGYSDLPFHNWYHALAVFQFIYAIIRKFGLLEFEIITELEALALLIAAISHDLEFRGPTTRYQPIRGNVLASLYSSPGCVEKCYSAVQTLRLFSLPDANILEGMPPKRYKDFINLLYLLIKGTDISEHVNNLTYMNGLLSEKKYDETNPEHRKYVCTIIMTASDMCSYSKTWGYSKFIAECHYKELYRFRDLCDGGNIFDLRNLLPNPRKIPAFQVQFIKDYVVPTYDTLQKLIPSTEELNKTIEVNLFRWTQLKNKVDEKGVGMKMPVTDLIKDELSDESLSDVQ